MFYFSNDQIDEIEKRLAVRAKRDTDFEVASYADDSDLVAIIHDGRNMICRLDKLPGKLTVKRYNDISSDVTTENILEVPTAFSLSVIKSLFGIEQLPDYTDNTPYNKGDHVKHIDKNGILRGYIFKKDKSAGYWDYSCVEEINYNSLLTSIGDILSEFKVGGRVYVIENYFTDGTANKAIADEDGRNLKKYYALKADIPDVNKEIADAIAVKLDNTPAGSNNRPIYIANNPETGHGESKEIDGLDVPGKIHSDSDISASGGVSAHGITDLSVTPSGGGQPLKVISYDNLDDLQNEELDQVATAYAVSRLKKDIGMANIPEFNSMMSYKRGDVVRYGTRGYRFITNKEPGQWDPSYCDYLEYAALAKPLQISRRVIENLKLD